MNDDKLEDEIAALIAENVVVGYQFRPDGTINAETIRVYAKGAAIVVIYRLRSNETSEDKATQAT